MDDFTVKFSNRLRELRIKKGFKQTEVFADNIRTWQSYERGERKPSLEGLVEIAKKFNVSTDYLLGLSDEMVPQAREFQEATGLTESSVSALVSLRENKATAGLEIINQLFESGTFYCALTDINKARIINDNLGKEFSDKVKPGAVAVRLENNFSHNLAEVLVSGEVLRDYLITRAIEDIKNLVNTIVKGGAEDGKH